MHTSTEQYRWWNASLDEVGPKAMEKSLTADAGWNEIRQSGREELQLAIAANGMLLDRTRRVLDLGCGLGRVSFALAELAGSVVGMDISAPLIEAARRDNSRENLTYEVVSGSPLCPGEERLFDTIFANEVFYHLNPQTLAAYMQDAYRLLRDDGEFVFQLNLEPIRWTTRLSWGVRSLLHACGVNEWRGWPTSPGFRRWHYPIPVVREMLHQAGFDLKLATQGASIRQSWFVAVKATSERKLQSIP